MSPICQQSFLDTSVSTSNKVDPGRPIIESIWKVISQEQASDPEHPSTQISHDDLLSYNFRQLALSKSFHVQSINPFNFQTRSLIAPVLEIFLQKVNNIYYLIDPKDLWSFVDSTLDSDLETPNLTMSVVCFCVAIGYQNCSTGAPDMAIMWYENGRRYLDDHDWSLDPTVMRILVLIGVFHMAERPSTSSHYLGKTSLTCLRFD
jgi:hypothetical protein